jgi:TPR repeat protein
MVKPHCFYSSVIKPRPSVSHHYHYLARSVCQQVCNGRCFALLLLVFFFCTTTKMPSHTEQIEDGPFAGATGSAGTTRAESISTAATDGRKGEDGQGIDMVEFDELVNQLFASSHQHWEQLLDLASGQNNKPWAQGLIAAAFCSNRIFIVENDAQMADRYGRLCSGWLQSQVVRGCSHALCLLGMFHDIGVVYPRDELEAVRLYELAGQLALAQYLLGVHCGRGTGGSADPVKAVSLFEQSGGQNFAPAQYELAMCYLRGKGAEEDHARGLEWLRIAATNGSVQAANQLGQIYEKGILGAPKNALQAVAYYREAARRQYPIAQFNLGAMYYDCEDGIGVDAVEAAYWFQAASDRGYLAASCALAHLYCKGFGVVRDDSVALSLFSKAAALGSAEAQYRLGHYYNKGRIVSKDISAAVKFFSLAASQEYGPAKKMLQKLEKVIGVDDEED